MKYGCMNLNCLSNPFNRLEIMENVILAYSRVYNSPYAANFSTGL